MTGKELRKAKRRNYQKRYQQDHPEVYRKADGRRNEKQRKALEPFGVKSARGLVQMWLTGKIQIIKDGKTVTP